MNKFITSLFTCIGLLAFAGSSTAQSVDPTTFNISGGFAKIGYYDYEWSVGELCAIETFAATPNVTLTQGVLQPFTDRVTPGPLILIFERDEYRIFPNPTAGNFELNFMIRVPGQLKLQLHDNKGSLIDVREYRYNGNGVIEKYNLSGMPDGVYTIHATLIADERFGNGIVSVRNSGLRVVKISTK